MTTRERAELLAEARELEARGTAKSIAHAKLLRKQAARPAPKLPWRGIVG